MMFIQSSIIVNTIYKYSLDFCSAGSYYNYFPVVTQMWCSFQHLEVPPANPLRRCWKKPQSPVSIWHGRDAQLMTNFLCKWITERRGMVSYLYIMAKTCIMSVRDFTGIQNTGFE